MILDAVTVSQSICSNLSYCWVFNENNWWDRNDPWCCYCFSIYLFKPFFMFVNVLFVLVRQSNPWCCYCFMIYMFASLFFSWTMLLLLHDLSVWTLMVFFLNILFLLVRQSNPWCSYCFTINLFKPCLLLGMWCNILVRQKQSLILLLIHDLSVRTIVFICEPIIFVGKTERSLILLLLHN